MRLPSPDERATWSGLDGPEALFVALWRILEQVPPDQRSAARVHDPAGFETPLARNGAKEALRALVAAIEGKWPDPSGGDYAPRAIGLVLAAMQQIDSCFEGLHPRDGFLPARFRTDNPEWVEMARVRRTIHGTYHETDDERLVARGPFSRAAQASDAASADTVRGRFNNLAVGRLSTRQEGRTIRVELLRFSDGIDAGVPRVAPPGAETVAFIAVAEASGDLVCNVTDKGAGRFIDISPAATLDGATRVLRAADHLGMVDIALAPELTMGPTCEDTLSLGLRAARGKAPRLLLAGTGLAGAPGGGFHNEARMMNANGRVLWRQRKTWPFGMHREKAEGYHLVKPGRPDPLFEDIVSSDVLVVADVDGLGRCVVLICQDLESSVATEDVLDDYQPDWVLVPILDPGIKVGGWAHARALALSSRSQARFLVSSSLTMCHWKAAAPSAPPSIGLAVGPKQPSKADAANEQGDMGRAVALVQAGHVPGALCAALKWRSGTGAWSQTRIVVDQPA